MLVSTCLHQSAEPDRPVSGLQAPWKGNPEANLGVFKFLFGIFGCECCSSLAALRRICDRLVAPCVAPASAPAVCVTTTRVVLTTDVHP